MSGSRYVRKTVGAAVAAIAVLTIGSPVARTADTTIGDLNGWITVTGKTA